jgi:hypothetical protein
MSNDLYTSPCPFCGQYDFTIDFSGCKSAEDAETVATAACSCDGAEQERKLRDRIAAARATVTAMCAPAAGDSEEDRKINAAITDILCEIVELAVRHKVVSASIAATRSTKISIKASADEVKISREDKEKEVETV